MAFLSNLPRANSSYIKKEYEAILKKVASGDPTLKKADFKTKTTIINALIRRGYTNNDILYELSKKVREPVRMEANQKMIDNKAIRDAMPKVRRTRAEIAAANAAKQEAKDIAATEREFMRGETRAEKAAAKARANAAKAAARQEQRDIAATEKEYMREEAKAAKLQAKKDNRVYKKRFIGPLKPTQSRRKPRASTVQKNIEKQMAKIEKAIKKEEEKIAKLQARALAKEEKIRAKIQARATRIGRGRGQ